METTICESQEGGLLSNLILCSKNEEDDTHHGKFRLVEEFGVEDLKDTRLSEEEKVKFVDDVKKQAQFVVRITSRSVSEHRPDTTRDGDPYPFADMRGRSDVTHVGSGWVYPWSIEQTSSSEIPYGCGRHGGGQERPCYRFTLKTDRHVIFDISEFEKCRVDFF